MKMTLEQLLELGEEHAREILLTHREKELMPTWHLLAPEGEKDLIVGTPWTNDFEKKLSVAQVKFMARQANAEAVCHVSECWMVDTQRIKGMPSTSWHRDRYLKNMPRPSQNPDRIEAVIIICNDGSRTIAKSLQMIRDKPGGHLISLIDYGSITQGGGHFESWMLDGMIPPKSGE